MHIIDTHSHATNLEGVDKIIYACADPDDVEKVFAAAAKNENIFCTLGIHPQYAGAEPNYEHLLSDPKVVGVGEIGLDYHPSPQGGAGTSPEDKKRQIELFQRQLEIARRANLPVAIHSRDAESDTAEILKDMPAAGVMHCFTSGYGFAHVMLDRGFYISASGIVTFKNAGGLRDTFAKIPPDRILAETDSPWCAPVPHRGEECAPAMVVETIKVLADVKKIPMVEMAGILWDNAHRLYPKLCRDK
ncbi:MAG: TatD family hydrolase [Rickettsiales bacterium]|jgi:TatD DNase family protein|nr:TatD family hydrolase [Rickettsiales bacterium]